MPTTLHNLKTGKKRNRKRVGRGDSSGKGSYSGRGIKGQRARSGGKSGLKKRSLMRQVIKKIPKIGGFKSLKRKAITITTSALESNFKDGDTVSLNSLIKKNLITQKYRRAKIVYKGKISKKLTIKNITVSKKAGEIIKKSGGKIVKK